MPPHCWCLVPFPRVRWPLLAAVIAAGPGVSAWPNLQAVAGRSAPAPLGCPGITISAPGIAAVAGHCAQSAAFANSFDLFPSSNSGASPDAQLYLLTWGIFVLKMLLVNADAITAVWATASNCVSFASCPPGWHTVIWRKLQLINTVLSASLHVPVSSCSIWSFWFHVSYFWQRRGMVRRV